MNQKKKMSLFIITVIILILIIAAIIGMNNGKNKNIPETNSINSTIEVNEGVVGPQDPIDELPTESVETQTAQ